MKVVYSPKFLEYKESGHPESPERIKRIYETLVKDPRYTFVTPQQATLEDLLLVHSKEHVEQVKDNSFFNVDTPNISNIYEYGVLSVGAAIKTSEIALQEKYAFSLARPPGHHAGKDSIEGFCYFNNIAVAATKLLKNDKKVAILDIDVHHGNGTQEIFLGKENVVFCSLHQVPLYPGTGWKSENNCYNFPLKPETDFDLYRDVLVQATDIIQKFTPTIVGVSLGFDTYKDDPLAQLHLETTDYNRIGVLIKKINKPTFFVLEGGYSEYIGECAFQFLQAFL